MAAFVLCKSAKRDVGTVDLQAFVHWFEDSMSAEEEYERTAQHMNDRMQPLNLLHDLRQQVRTCVLLVRLLPYHP